MTGRGDWLVWTGLAVVAVVAAVVSYRHLAALALSVGEDRVNAAILPLSVDGLMVVAGLVLYADARVGRRGRVLPWLALLAGVGASVAGNVAAAEPTMAGRAVAAWAPVALALSVELVLRHVRRRGVAGDDTAATPTTPVSPVPPMLANGDALAADIAAGFPAVEVAQRHGVSVRTVQRRAARQRNRAKQEVTP